MIFPSYWDGMVENRDAVIEAAKNEAERLISIMESIYDHEASHLKPSTRAYISCFDLS